MDLVPCRLIQEQGPFHSDLSSSTDSNTGRNAPPWLAIRVELVVDERRDDDPPSRQSLVYLRKIGGGLRKIGAPIFTRPRFFSPEHAHPCGKEKGRHRKYDGGP